MKFHFLVNFDFHFKSAGLIDSTDSTGGRPLWLGDDTNPLNNQ